MKQNKQKTTRSKKTAAAAHDCPHCTESAIIAREVKMTADDFRSALLVVSIAVNVFMLTTWLVAQNSQMYATQLAQFIAG